MCAGQWQQTLAFEYDYFNVYQVTRLALKIFLIIIFIY
jgi:hypothetical protein